MSMLQSRNPAMGAFDKTTEIGIDRENTKVMTINGTVTATAILLSIVATVAILVYTPLAKAVAPTASGVTGSMPTWTMPALIGSFIGTLVLSIAIYFKPRSAPFVAPVHAGVEGVFVGILSFYIPLQFIGGESVSLVIQAVLATIAITAAMLLGYATGVLRVGGFIKKVMITAVSGLMLYVVALMLLPMFGVNLWNGYRDTGLLGIGFTGLCVGLSSLFLLWDFEYIEKGVEARAPKYMEWVGAWGLMVTLVWLYIEVLRLLAKLQSRD
jgi:uncharacterized YccA/Bax inhibitor family protein